MNEIPEIELGTALFSIVEPHKGHEREFHRWYERDHFFAGCMIGANYFSGRRFIATKPLKALRFPIETPVTPDISRGSFLVLYWILDGTYPETLRWSVDQVLQLHRQNRMQPPRDNISTAFYRYVWAVGRDEDGVPPELALEHPYKGVAVAMIDRAEGADEGEFEARLRDLLDATIRTDNPTERAPIGLTLCLRPQSLPDDAPSYVPRPDQAELDRRYLLLAFLDGELGSSTMDWLRVLDAALSERSLGKVVYAAPFIPTIPGTNRFVDEI